MNDEKTIQQMKLGIKEAFFSYNFFKEDKNFVDLNALIQMELEFTKKVSQMDQKREKFENADIYDAIKNKRFFHFLNLLVAQNVTLFDYDPKDNKNIFNNNFRQAQFQTQKTQIETKVENFQINYNTNEKEELFQYLEQHWNTTKLLYYNDQIPTFLHSKEFFQKFDPYKKNHNHFKKIGNSIINAIIQTGSLPFFKCIQEFTYIYTYAILPSNIINNIKIMKAVPIAFKFNGSVYYTSYNKTAGESQFEIPQELIQYHMDNYKVELPAYDPSKNSVLTYILADYKFIKQIGNDIDAWYQYHLIRRKNKDSNGKYYQEYDSSNELITRKVIYLFYRKVDFDSKKTLYIEQAAKARSIEMIKYLFDTFQNNVNPKNAINFEWLRCVIMNTNIPKISTINMPSPFGTKFESNDTKNIGLLEQFFDFIQEKIKNEKMKFNIDAHRIFKEMIKTKPDTISYFISLLQADNGNKYKEINNLITLNENDRYTLFYMALESVNSQTLEILDKFLKIDEKNFKINPFYYVISSDNIQNFDYIIKKLENQPKLTNNFLNQTVDVGAITPPLSHKIVNSTPSSIQQFTPLMYAAILAKPRMIEKLLKANANPNIFNSEHPILIAYITLTEEEWRMKIMRLFAQYQSLFTVFSFLIQNNSLLHLAISNRDIEFFNYLMSRRDISVIINSRNRKGETPIDLVSKLEREAIKNKNDKNNLSPKTINYMKMKLIERGAIYKINNDLKYYCF